MAKLVDATDLKSVVPSGTYPFDSGWGHHFLDLRSSAERRMLGEGGVRWPAELYTDMPGDGRVTGNNAVHPGDLALKEDTGTAMALLPLINLVVERRIAMPKRIEEMFVNLPPSALKAIKKRGNEPG